MFIWGGRNLGYTIDKQYRDPGGKPIYVVLPLKYRSFFKINENTYFSKDNPLRVSICIQFVAYIFAFVELGVLLCGIISGRYIFFSNAATKFFVIGMFLIGFVIAAPYVYKYNQNMYKTYEYDWITALQEGLFQYSKRKCKIIKKINDNIYQIEVGILKKHKYIAESMFVIEEGTMLYAVHYYHSKDISGPFWEIKKF